MINNILKLLYQKYQETLSDEIVIEFPIEIRERRTEIGNELKTNNYIVKFDTYGKQYFRCTVSQKFVDSFKN